MARPSSAPDFSHIRPLLLGMARERSREAVLRFVVERLAGAANIAAARIWTLDAPGETGAEPTLRLVACEGSQRGGDAIPWSQRDRELQRSTRGNALVARAIDTARGVSVNLGPEEAEGAELEWELRHGVRGIAVQPLAFHDELLGAIAVLTWVPIASEGPDWLRVIADHAAAALANSRAFEEIQELRRRLAMENDYLKEELHRSHSSGGIVGASASRRRMLQQIELVAPTDASVVVRGESGTGKELVAREIHRQSARRDRPLVRVNCAAVPRELYESEFFGHVRGAFTGAVRDRVGRFELANGGTLFLDEVGELPLDVQGKLLRVLQEGQYERVGDSRTQEVDVRIIAATHRDLEAEVQRRRFREDLYYRLNVFPIRVEPLRERLADIAPLARHFLERGAVRLRKRAPRLTASAIRQLESYSWPGNVRELQNVIERALITSTGGVLDLGLPADGATEPPLRTDPSAPPEADDRLLLDAEVRELERANILRALERSKGRVYGPDGAAALLGMKATTLASRIQRQGLRRSTAPDEDLRRPDAAHADPVPLREAEP